LGVFNVIKKRDIEMYRNIGFKERRYIEELRILTKSVAVDCLIDERFDRVIYVIKPGDMGLAIGKKGDNIRKMQKVLGRRIEMVEYAEDEKTFIANIFRPAEVLMSSETEAGGKINVVVGKKSDLGIAIGKGGSTIEKARLLVKRFFGHEIGDVILAHEEEEA
jgi:N utilization substance protein A